MFGKREIGMRIGVNSKFECNSADEWIQIIKELDVSTVIAPMKYTEIRNIIDEVKPKYTFYAIEPMQWMHPDSPDDYLKLLQDMDRHKVAVHLDYVNMINSFERYHNRKAFINECYRKLGPYIKSIHAKDVQLGNESPCCLREVTPGAGDIDFTQVFTLSNRLSADMPVFVEHLSDFAAYKDAIKYMRNIGRISNIDIVKLKVC
jgi:Sugar phosphate isomerases/epimerases